MKLIELSDTELVIGSGLAAFGACLALIDRGKRVHVFDVGKTLPPHSAKLKSSLSVSLKNLESKNFQKESNQSKTSLFRIPKKTIFGSDFYLEREIQGLSCAGRVPPASHALGGMAAAWGASVLPLSNADYERWNLPNGLLDSSYEAILSELSYTFEDDDLSTEFPTFGAKKHNLKATTSARSMLERLKNVEHNKYSNWIIGKARNLVNLGENGCVYCGQCMSGCATDAIFNPGIALQRLARQGKITYSSGIEVKSISPGTGGIEIICVENNEKVTFRTTRCFLAAGATNTAQIILNSPAYSIDKCRLKTRGGFVLPLFDWRLFQTNLRKLMKFSQGTSMTRESQTDSNTLASIFLEMQVPRLPGWVHVQLSPDNELFGNLVENISKKSRVLQEWLQLVLSAFSIALVNFASPSSGEFLLKVNRSINDRPSIQVSYKKKKPKISAMYMLYLHGTKIFINAGLWPIWFAKIWNSGTYHIGSSFPMKIKPEIGQCDLYGQLNGVENVHIVDTSIFPDLPGTTVGLTVMANAYRIASVAI